MLFGEQYTTDKKPEFKSSEELGLSTHFETDKVIDEITNHIGGYSWEVDLFNQLISPNDASTPLDLNLTPAVQRYRRVENLEIKLQSPISSSTVTDVKGEATINIGSAIYKYDMFTAKMRDNRIGIFKIDNINNNTYELNQIVSIEFSILGFADTEFDLYQNLLSKVDTEYVYDLGFKKQNGSPIISKKDFISHNAILENCTILMSNYLAKFVDSNQLIALNVDGNLLVDPFLNDFILAVFSPREISLLQNIRRVETDNDRSLIPTIYKSILGYVDLAYVKKLKYTYTRNDPYLKNYSDVKYTVDVDKDDLKIDGVNYFIDDSFYTYNGDTVSEDAFTVILLRFIDGKDTSTLEEIKTCIDTVLASSDINIYFKLPILIMIYRQTSYMFKG